MMAPFTHDSRIFFLELSADTHATIGLRRVSAFWVPCALKLLDTYPDFATLARTLLLYLDK